jgi:hypothetical protein
MKIYYLYIHSDMFRSYDHHQAEKYIATLGLLNWQRIRCKHPRLNILKCNYECFNFEFSSKHHVTELFRRRKLHLRFAFSLALYIIRLLIAKIIRALSALWERLICKRPKVIMWVMKKHENKYQKGLRASRWRENKHQDGGRMSLQTEAHEP